MINATMMTVNLFGENLYILWDEKTRDAVVVDPGMMRDAEPNSLRGNRSMSSTSC